MILRLLLLGLASLAWAAPAFAQNPTAADIARFRAQTNVVRSGLGNDPGLPSGQPFNFPAGVTLAAPIRGVADPSDCANESHGSGFSVMVCLPLCNRTGGRVRVEIPPGLVIVSKSTGPYQNGLLLERVVVDVPPTVCGPGGIPLDRTAEDVARDAATTAPEGFPVALNLYCLNESGQPSENGIPYALGPITNDPAVQDLIARVNSRTLDEQGADTVQTALYSITEGRGLNWNDERALERL